MEDAPQGVQKLLAFLERGFVKISFAYVEHAGPIRALMRTYMDQPMSFADACLVRMAGRRLHSRVFTTDGDFHVYRTSEAERLDVVMPGAQ